MLCLSPATIELGAAASEAERRRLARFDPDAPPETRKRRWLFWTVCLPLRAVLAACSTLAATERCAPVEFVLAAYALYWGVNLLQNFARGLLRPVPDERGNFNGRVWWQWHRAAHGALLCAYAGATFGRVPWAYAFALADVGLAAVAGAVHYAIEACVPRAPRL